MISFQDLTTRGTREAGPLYESSFSARMGILEGLHKSFTLLWSSQGKHDDDRVRIWQAFELFQVFFSRLVFSIILELDGARASGCAGAGV